MNRGACRSVTRQEAAGWRNIRCFSPAQAAPGRTQVMHHAFGGSYRRQNIGLFILVLQAAAAAFLLPADDDTGMKTLMLRTAHAASSC